MRDFYLSIKIIIKNHCLRHLNDSVRVCRSYILKNPAQVWQEHIVDSVCIEGFYVHQRLKFVKQYSYVSRNGYSASYYAIYKSILLPHTRRVQ